MCRYYCVPTRAPQVSDIPNPDGKTYPLAYLEFRDLDWNSEKNIIKGVSSIRDYGLPCREIGLIPHSCFGGFSFTTDLRRYYLVLSNRAETVTVSEEEFEGDKLVKIVWVVKTEFPNEVKSKMLEQMTTEFPDKVKALTEEQLVRFTKEQLVHRIQEEFWLDPNKDYIVRKAIHSSNGGFVYDLSNTVKYDHKSKFWYPNSWIFKSTTDRGKTNVREEGTMELISINETFPKNFFDLSDIKQLERGTPVRWELSQPPLAKGQLYWSGKEVICKSDYRLSRETAKESRNWTLRRILTLCCVNAVFISLWTDWFFFRRYQKSLDK
ncbi:hypothetical protein FACS18942_11080 [Planctomycetales bacterium]|nr:hypothetical protein FACS18942_11080 [Planctomycetales bacterium]GHT39246.1 hypothetical protein FACS189427_13410 [Planctomycetales bacterium]